MPAKKADKITTDKKEKKSKSKEAEIEASADVSDETVGTEKVMHEVDSKYRMILLAAQRSKQLQKGATVRVNEDPRKHKPTYIALKEMKHRKVPFEFLEEE
jgi:DNA-directed RNA polymerase omega subunit